MTPRKAPPEMFNRPLVRLRRTRAARRGNSFLIERCAKDAADRLLDINRQFEEALIIAPAEFHEPFLDAMPEPKRPKSITRCHFTDYPEGLDFTVDDAALPFGDNQFDIVISILSMHAINDLPGALIQVRQCLKPDGLFIGAMFGGETLTEFRTALYAADEAATGGMSPRVYPFADYSQAAQLLQRTGFALPVVDMDRFKVSYKNWRTLIDDLRDLGETNALAQQGNKPFPLESLEPVIEARLDAGGKFPVSFEILWLTGWSPHESQQKPLKPGSAKMRLADALQSKEMKLPND